MAERTKVQPVTDVHENCEIRLSLLGVIEKQRNTIAMLVAVLVDLGFEPNDFFDLLG